jgi:hypothetical protein
MSSCHLPAFGQAAFEQLVGYPINLEKNEAYLRVFELLFYVSHNIIAIQAEKRTK